MMQFKRLPPPRFYGLPKIHKPGMPIRPIIALSGALVMGVSQWLFWCLNPLNEGSMTTVTSSQQLICKIGDRKLERNEGMTTLFRLIPANLTHGTIELRRSEEKQDEQGLITNNLIL